METILLQIASYRDWELVNTIESALQSAETPARLRFAIVMQDESSNFSKLDKYINDDRFKIFFQDWRESRGVGQARGRSDEMYDDETYFFQVDSHMRFIRSWDSLIIEEWKSLGDNMAVLSAYPPAYKYDDSGKEKYIVSNPNRLVVHDTYMKTIPVFFGHAIPETAIGHRGAFVAGGMQFGPGRAVRDVPYEKDICFIGEEVVHSLRLFDAGYRVYSPINQVAFHLYIRSENQPESYHFWQDFLGDEELKPIYEVMNRESYSLVMKYLLGEGPVDAKSVREFENFSGVDFAKTRVHKDTYDITPLPMSIDDSWRKESIEPKKQN